MRFFTYQPLALNIQCFSDPNNAGGTGGAGQPGNQDPISNPGGSSNPSNTNQGNVGNQDPTNSGGNNTNDQTFTQADVNNLVTRESRKATENLLKDLGIEDFENAKEGYQKFLQWREEQQTDAEKQSEKLSALEKTSAADKEKIGTLEAQLSAVKAGVNADSLQDVVTLAKNLVTDEVDMDKAIAQVVEKYPHFAAEQPAADPKPTISTGQHSRQGGNTEAKSLADALAQHYNS